MSQFIPRSKHIVLVIEASQLMLYREIITVLSKIYAKRKSKLCGKNVEFFHVKVCGM